MLHRLRSFAVQCPKGRATAEGSHCKAEYLLDGSEHADAGAGLVLTGIMCEPEQVLDILADNGIAVVADDLVQESQQFRADTPENGGGGLKRLALQWSERYGCSLIHELGKPRGGELARLCADTGADGVINCMVKFCDPEEYDQPWLEKDLRAAGIPCTSIEIDQQNASFEQIRTRVQTFCELL